MRGFLLFVTLLAATIVTAQDKELERSWDGQYYYPDYSTKGYVLKKGRDGVVDTMRGYIKQFNPRNELKSCATVMWKRRKTDKYTKFKPEDIEGYVRWAEVYDVHITSKGDKVFIKRITEGEVIVYEYTGKSMAANFGRDLSFSTGPEIKEQFWIKKDDKMEKIDWEDPYMHEKLFKYVDGCDKVEPELFKEGMSKEDLLKAVGQFDECK